jgi:POT family proton-dependent oligopeptide transporter
MTDAHRAAATSLDRGFFGHPRALATLFLTELWERFSYYGMRALLILFMTDAVTGMVMSENRAAAIYGLYVFGVYALALPGGWLADRLLGKRRAVLHGGILIALGHYSMAVPGSVTFYLGLILIALGTGLLKPNVSAIVGDLYQDRGARRDAGFSIFYMGINIGAVLGPIFCPLLAARYGWHVGFGLAGAGMTLAVVAYLRGYQRLAGTGELRPEQATPPALSAARRQLVIGLGVLLGLGAALVALSSAGIVPLTIERFAALTGYIVLAIAVLYFGFTIAFVCRDRDERKRVAACAILFVGATVFWAGFEQAGSSMNLFARDFTDRVILDWEMPAGMLQSVNALFIILLAPVVGGLWVALGKRNPSIPVKFGVGLLLLGVGFLVLAWGASQRDAGVGRLGMHWLVVTYFFHTVGELCLSPVGLSSVTKLAPERLVSQMMGTWFMGMALGNLIAGLAAGYVRSMPIDELFAVVAVPALAGGVLFLLLSPLIRRMTVGID